MKYDFSEIKKIDKWIFCSIVTLLLILLFFPLFYHMSFKMNDFSKVDFENELMGKAYFASLNKNYNQEIDLYLQLISKVPELKAEIYPKIGNAFYSNNKPLKAIEYYNQALMAGCMDSIEVFYGVAMVAQRLKRYQMAIKYYQKCIRDEAYSSNANFNLGNIYFLIKRDNQRALEFYKNAVEEPSVSALYRKMLRREMKVYTPRKSPEIYKRLAGQYEKGIAATDMPRFDEKELLKNAWGENQAIIQNYIGTIYAMDNKNVLAFNHFKKALKIDPQLTDVKVNLQKILTLLGKEHKTPR